MTKKLLLVGLLIFSISINAQKNPLPLNIQKAYQNQTRSKDGTPGSNYWQNSADYSIDATLDTKNDVLEGSANIKYYNNSPDTLKRIVIRLYQDFFRKGNARQWPARDGDITEGVQISNLKINGEKYDPDEDFPNWWITNFIVRLKSPIAPGSTAELEIDWSFEVPTVRGLRMRKYDEGHYFIAYWYPQIAVYDDIDGWDRIEYIGTVEFYNDFNNYDINITVPGDYMVWATGELQNREDILQEKIVNRYTKALESDEVIRIVTQKDLEKKKVFQPADYHTWHFKASHVPDFSFGASNHSNWDGVSLIVDEITGRRVLTDVAYPNDVDHWDQGAEVSRASVEYMSFELPGIPFPYPHMTSFCSGRSGGGMETPMMANNGAPKKFGSFVELLFHEISHTYFPFYMGTNERKYAWMDEGWAAYLPGELSERLAPEGDYIKYTTDSYLYLAGQETELPLMVPTFQHNSWASARVAAYSRPAVAYRMLREAMGDELFKKALHTYMERWNGKHPLPYDFFNTFNEVNKKNLDWFWEPWFFQNGYPDLAIAEVRDGKMVIVEKVGTHPVTVVVTYFTEDGFSDTITVSTSVWKSKRKKIRVDLPEDKVVTKVVLGNDHVPDVNLENNVWEKE